MKNVFIKQINVVKSRGDMSSSSYSGKLPHVCGGFAFIVHITFNEEETLSDQKMESNH